MCILTIGRNCPQRIDNVCRYDLLKEPRSPYAGRLDLSSADAHQAPYGTSAKQSVGFIEDNPAGIVAAHTSVDERLRPPNLDTFEECRRCGCCSSSLPNLASRMRFVRCVGPEQHRNVHVVRVLGADEAEEHISDPNKYQNSGYTHVRQPVASFRSNNGDSEFPVTSLTIDLIAASSFVALNFPSPGLPFG